MTTASTPTAGADGPRRIVLDGELPAGTVVLDASAGTGKTYAIAALVTRYVAEGRCTLPELLVVTFTRAATAELRDRVRERLVDAAAHLEAAIAGATPATDDAVLRCLTRVPEGAADQAAGAAAADRTELRRRHERLVAALTDFDAATISTIHGFSQQVLRGVGLLADVDRDAALLEDQRELLEAVVDDVMVRRFSPQPPPGTDLPDEAAPRRGVLLEIASQVAAGDPRTPILPLDDHPTGRDCGSLARTIRAEVERRKRDLGVLSHDDLLTRLRDAIDHPDHGPAAIGVLRDRYKVALIDEFQDTDPVQWQILRAAFHDGTASTTADRRALVLIGDPKQAIYAFRGADVQAYLDATEAADQRLGLDVNWRSDGALLGALNGLLRGLTFGDRRIAYHPVEPAPGRDGTAVTGVGPPVQLRVLTAIDGVERYQGKLTAKGVRSHLALDTAAQVVSLLDGDARCEGEQLRPEDIAVLVRTNAEAGQVQRALLDVGVPAVVNGVGSVFETPAANDWRRLLEALERPNATTTVRAAALTPFIGWDGRQVALADDRDWDRLHDRLHVWAGVLRQHGVASLLRTVTVETEVGPRLLACTGGERVLTDLLHVGELLHRAELTGDLGASALISWLRDRIAEADEPGVPAEDRARRLESDAEAVQLLTVHRAKGLEFPVVLCPFLWSAGRGVSAPVVIHDPQTDQRRIDVGPRDRDGFETSRQLAEREQDGEALRLLYVALTRARHRLVVWWANCGNTKRSSLARVLFARGEDGVLADGEVAPPRDAVALDTLAPLVQEVGDHLEVVEVPAALSPSRWSDRTAKDDELAVARLERELDHRWRRTSYSALTRGAGHDAPGSSQEPQERVVSEPEEPVKDDEALGPLAPVPPHRPADRARSDVHAGSDTASAEHDLRDHPLPLADVPGGTEVGTLVHAVLEHAAFDASDLPGHVEEVLTEQVRLRRLDLDVPVWRDGLVAAIRTPLGALAEGRPLSSFARGDRLDELEFELPLAGGDRPHASRQPVTVAAIGRLLDLHLPADDPLAGYGRALRRSPGFHVDVRGFLTGSIDLVLRVRGAGGEDRYLVADHKTNRLGFPEQPTAWHYRPSALAEAMVHGHYPLQALLYQVALHRTLRWRLPGYDPARHLGGILYLFLRGMAGPDVPDVDGQPCGVFAWRPPVDLVEDLSRLLDGQEVAA